MHVPIVRLQDSTLQPEPKKRNSQTVLFESQNVHIVLIFINTQKTRRGRRKGAELRSASTTAQSSALLAGLDPETHEVQRVEQPRQEIDGLRLYPRLETLLGSIGNRLDELVRRHGALEVARRPYASHNLAK